MSNLAVFIHLMLSAICGGGALYLAGQCPHQPWTKPIVMGVLFGAAVTSFLTMWLLHP